MNHPSRLSASAPLTVLKPGQQGTVCALCCPDCPGGLRRRLQGLGFVPGTRVCCVGVSPLGDPAAYRLKGTVIALRAGDAGTVLIRKEPERAAL